MVVVEQEEAAGGGGGGEARDEEAVRQMGMVQQQEGEVRLHLGARRERIGEAQRLETRLSPGEVERELGGTLSGETRSRVRISRFHEHL